MKCAESQDSLPTFTTLPSGNWPSMAAGAQCEGMYAGLPSGGNGLTKRASEYLVYYAEPRWNDPR